MRTANEFQKDMIMLMRKHANHIKELRENYEELSVRSRNTGLYGIDKIHQLKDDAMQAYTDMMNAIDNAQIEVQAACKAYALEVNNADALNPADLTDDVKLLNCGAPLSENDIQQMRNRNSDNNTMLRLIANYAREHNIRMIPPFTPMKEEHEAIEGMQGTAAIIFKRPNYATVEKVMEKVFGVEE